MTRDEAWALEYAKRKVIGQAVALSPYVDSFQLNAQSFILSLDERYLAALSAYLGVERPHGVLKEMTKPGFLRSKRGLIHRLTAWGWNPYETISRPPGFLRDRAEATFPVAVRVAPRTTGRRDPHTR